VKITSLGLEAFVGVFSVLDPESSKITFVFQKLIVVHVELQGSEGLERSSSVSRAGASCFFVRRVFSQREFHVKALKTLPRELPAYSRV